ncbi:MAG: helix-turn-helix transcriptional regulator [Gammaproteobacteria bacterium]|nr:helix-turn-helix transcriptional regulator [Gammaproteobacteria bacterium]
MNMKIGLGLTWHIELHGQRYAIEALLFDLLEAVERGGHLNFAASATGVSYRHAWGLMRTWEERLKLPLLDLQRGRGATLTASGRALLLALSQAAAQTQGALSQAAAQATALLAPTLESNRALVRIASSNSELINGLVDALYGAQWQVVLDVLGSEAALHRYQRGDVDVVGFHLPLGELGRTVGMALTALLDDARDQVFLLELRALGLMSRPERPLSELDELIGDDVRFINRQPGSGTRLVFDGLLGTRGIAPGTIAGYRNEEYTHSAVAAMVASGSADAGFGTATAAARFRLAFKPFVQERFYLCVRRSAARELSEAVAAYVQATLASGERAPAASEIQPSVGLLRRLHNPM